MLNSYTIGDRVKLTTDATTALRAWPTRAHGQHMGGVITKIISEKLVAVRFDCNSTASKIHVQFIEHAN